MPTVYILVLPRRVNNSWPAGITKAEVSPSLLIHTTFTPLSPSLFTPHPILYSAPLINVQNTHSHTELDTVPPPPAWKCPLGKFRCHILHGAYQMHRFRRHTTWCRKLTERSRSTRHGRPVRRKTARQNQPPAMTRLRRVYSWHV